MGPAFAQNAAIGPTALHQTAESQSRVRDLFRDSPLPGLGAVLRKLDRYIERVKNSPSRVDVDASFLKAVQERPSGGGEGGVEFVVRMPGRHLENDGRLFCCLLVKMSGRLAGRSGWRQSRQLPIVGVNTH